MSRSELVFRAVEAVSNRYMLTNRAAHMSRVLRHPYKDGTPTSINKALARIAGVEEPRPLPSKAWRDMLARHIALEKSKQAEATADFSTPKQQRRSVSDEDHRDIIALASKGWTQAQIAAQIGFTQATVSNVLAANDAAIEKVLAAPQQEPVSV